MWNQDSREAQNARNLETAWNRLLKSLKNTSAFQAEYAGSIPATRSSMTIHAIAIRLTGRHLPAWRIAGLARQHASLWRIDLRSVSGQAAGGLFGRGRGGEVFRCNGMICSTGAGTRFPLAKQERKPYVALTSRGTRVKCLWILSLPTELQDTGRWQRVSSSAQSRTLTSARLVTLTTARHR